MFPLVLLLMLAACFSKEARKLPWPFYLLAALFVLIPFLLGPDHPYYTVYFVIPSSLLIARVFARQLPVFQYGAMIASLLFAFLIFPPHPALQTRLAEPLYRMEGYWNTHASAINDFLRNEKKVTVLGYPGHNIRFYLEPEVLVGRRMNPPYPTPYILILQNPEEARRLGGVAYEDEIVTIVRQ
jgi:hypothetical protein